jgi:hypothetical protein
MNYGSFMCTFMPAARDRLLPSIQEGGRLQRAIPGAMRVILPDSGHAPLLETGVDLAALMQVCLGLGAELPMVGIGNMQFKFLLPLAWHSLYC